MLCECQGEVMEFRIAETGGMLRCCNSTPCSYQKGDYILTLDNPLVANEKCEAAMNPATFALACKVLP